MKEIKCEEAKTYQKELASRRRKEAENLAKLTQWKMEEIEKEMGKENGSTPNPTEKSSAKWYQNIFK